MDEKEKKNIKNEQKTMEPSKVEIKYKDLYLNRRGGIYSSAARSRLWGAGEPFSGEFIANKRRTFWDRQKEYTKTALIDLALFCDVVDNDTLSEVVNVKSIELLLDTYFSRGGSIELNEPDLTKADVARFLIFRSFEYLKYSQRPPLNKYDNEIIVRAIVLSNNLTDGVDLRVRRREDSN